MSRFTLLFALSVLASSATAQPGNGASHAFGASRAVPDQYIVVFKDSVTNPRALEAQLVQQAGGQVTHSYQNVFKGFAARLPAAALTGLRNNPNVEFIEQDATVSLNESLISPPLQQPNATWGLDRIDQTSLPLDAAYNYQYTGAGVYAFIIDTGIRPSHTEFTGRVSLGFTAITDGNGSAVVAIHEYLFSVVRSGKLATDPLAGLKPVCGIVYVPSILGASKAAAGTKDLKGWLDKSKKLTISWTIGPTSTNIMMLALLEKTTGTYLNFKQFSSKSAAVGALVDGEVDLAEINPEVLLDPANKGIVPLAISSATRDPRLPNIPTFREQGIQVDYSVHRGLAVPQNTPASGLARLEQACQAAARDPELDQQLAKLGARSVFISGADYAKYLDRNRADYKSGIGPAN